MVFPHSVIPGPEYFLMLKNVFGNSRAPNGGIMVKVKKWNKSGISVVDSPPSAR